jgi:hypothetical protein
VTACASRNSVTNDTTRIRRLPAEYGVETQRMPRIDLAALLFASGAVDMDPVIDVLPRPSFGYGIPRYRPPMFAPLYAAARFGAPRLFAFLRLAVLLVCLLRDAEGEPVRSAEEYETRDARYLRPLNPIMF